MRRGLGSRVLVFEGNVTCPSSRHVPNKKALGEVVLHFLAGRRQLIDNTPSLYVRSMLTLVSQPASQPAKQALKHICHMNDRIL